MTKIFYLLSIFCVFLHLQKSNKMHIMKYSKVIMLLAAVVLSAMGCSKDDDKTQTVVQEPEVVADNIYQFKVLDGQGDSVSLSTYAGQVLLVVNTATQCGYTPQYEDLERIYETYRDSGFTVLDFPCNQFGGQAPGSYDDIHGFCTGEYNISFPQFAKINVNGSSASPLYVWLKEKKPGEIQWNFTKFLIDREGNVVRRFEPNANMTVMENAIKNQL